MRASVIYFQEYRIIKDTGKKIYIKYPEIDNSDILFYSETRPPNNNPNNYSQEELPIYPILTEILTIPPARRSGRIRRCLNRAIRTGNNVLIANIQDKQPPRSSTPLTPQVRKSGRLQKLNSRVYLGYR